MVPRTRNSIGPKVRALALQAICIIVVSTTLALVWLFVTDPLAAASIAAQGDTWAAARALGLLLLTAVRGFWTVF